MSDTTQNNAELSDEQLEQAAGGKGVSVPFGGTVCDLPGPTGPIKVPGDIFGDDPIIITTPPTQPTPDVVAF